MKNLKEMDYRELGQLYFKLSNVIKQELEIKKQLFDGKFCVKGDKIIIEIENLIESFLKLLGEIVAEKNCESNWNVCSVCDGLGECHYNYIEFCSACNGIGRLRRNK